MRSVIKYLQQKNMSPKAIHEDMVATLGGHAPSYATVKKWAKEFKLGRESTEDAPRSGRPKTASTDENINAIHDLVMSDRRITVRKIAEECRLNYGSVDTILTETLGLHKVSARWVPRMLTLDQKRERVVSSSSPSINVIRRIFSLVM